MTFINHQWIYFGTEYFFSEFIRFFRCPNLSTEYLCLFVLNNTSCPCRNPLTFTTVPTDFQFIQITMLYSIRIEFHFPHSGRILHAIHPIIAILFPTIEISNNIDFFRIRCPFTEHPSSFSTVQTKIKITGCKVRKC